MADFKKDFDKTKSSMKPAAGKAGKNAMAITDNRSAKPIQQKENNTGLPDNLKSGVENLSGYSMDDVKVHYNSDKPAQLNAHAYAQGTDIHLASGQEKHLPHEAWHVVQQKQGRVSPTMQMKGDVKINDDKNLEKEADLMSGKALQLQHGHQAIEHFNTNQYLKSKQTAQLASFFVDVKRYKTEEMSFGELMTLLVQLKAEKNKGAIKSLKDACEKEEKKLSNGSKISEGEFSQLLNLINEKPEEEHEKVLTTRDTKIMLQQNTFKNIAEEIGILKFEQIDHWIHKDIPLPESNVRGEIAEALTQQILLRQHPKKIILNSVKIVVDNGPHAQYRYTEKADIDHLILVQTPGGLVPEEIVETKAGEEGMETGALITKLNKKNKKLKEVKSKGYRILSNNKDITSQFDLNILDSQKINLTTSGIYENKIKLIPEQINGIFQFLQVVQQHYIAYKREW